MKRPPVLLPGGVNLHALYTMHRRAARLPRIAQELTRAIQAFSADLMRRRLQTR